MKKLANIIRKPYVGIAVSILIGFLIGAVVLLAAGFSPIKAYGAMFSGIFSRPKYIAQVIIRSTPIILTGLSIAFAYKTGQFNIGAEGQFIVGSVAAVIVGYLCPMPAGIHFLAVMLAGMLAAALWGGLVGLLKAKFGINEVITGIMLNWIAMYLNNYVIYNPALKKPNSESTYEVLDTCKIIVLNKWKNSAEGREVLMANETLADILIRSDLNYGIIIAVLAAIAVWFILNRTTKGFELRAEGFNSDASRFAGINVNRNKVISMMIAGALSGLAGVVAITGAMPHRISLLAAQQGIGFDGISVALIANASPFGTILAGFLFGGLKYGATSIQSKVGAPSEVINIVIGSIVYCVAISSAFRMFADYLEKKGEKKSA